MSYQQIYAWVRKYEEHGVAVLSDKRGKRKDISEMTEVERLRAENRLLQAQIKDKELEVALLKNSSGWKGGGTKRRLSRAFISGGADTFGRDFTAEKPNEKWLTDVTEMKYGNGEKLYLSAILDLKSRDIVAFAIGKSNNNQLVFDTFDMAVWRYPKAKPLIHSDRGLQYTSKQFKARLDAAGMAQSMSRVGRCIDNGPMEGFRGILKCEMYYLRRFKSYEALAAAIENFIYFYNHRRRQRKLERQAPADYRSLLLTAA